ncbi:hypothetical protein E4U54_000824 [Claviceps lovelessii]|nr:hypothetical protein E4U54_000824 [Claviceps lovelessii]
MKPSTILGSLFLTAVQAYNPRDNFEIHESSANLNARNGPGWCCIGAPHILPKMAFYMERGGDLYNVPSTTDCRVNVKRPSPTSCDGWTFQAVQACDHEDIVNDLGVMDAQWCKDRIGPSN